MARSNPAYYPYPNPGPYWAHGNFIEFENGRSYRVDSSTQRQASRYLIRVKEAEDAGRKIPRGPNGLTPGAAAVLLHYGRPKPKHRKRTRRAVCKPCAPKRRKRAVSKPAKRRTAAPARRAVVTREAPRKLVDQWNFIGNTFTI